MRLTAAITVLNHSRSLIQDAQLCKLLESTGEGVRAQVCTVSVDGVDRDGTAVSSAGESEIEIDGERWGPHPQNPSVTPQPDRDAMKRPRFDAAPV